MIFSFGGTLSSAPPWLVLPREKFTVARHGCRAISFVAYLFRRANCAATCRYLRLCGTRRGYCLRLQSQYGFGTRARRGSRIDIEILGTRRGCPKGKLIETAGSFGCRVFPSQSHLDRVCRLIRWKWNLARAEISYLGDPADK